MKRNLELVRKILLAIERSEQTQGTLSIEIDGFDPETVSYQVKLLAEARLIEANDLSTMYQFEWKPRSLTWAGHEFLDAARNDTVWNKTMTKLKDQATTVPFEVLKAVVMQTFKEVFNVG